MSSGSSLVASLPSVARKSSSTNTGIEADDKTQKPVTFEVNQLIDGKYTVRKKIDEGGFGAIYEVSCPGELQARYALKLALMKDADTEQSVRTEIGLLRTLSKLNPSFPCYRSSGNVDGFCYLVMDLLGLSLSEIQSYMPEERFTLGTTLRIGLQIIDAIEVIHSCFFIHRDIKPENMAIGYTDHRRIYLFDFGLARRFIRKDRRTGELEFRPERNNPPFRGTYHYCSLQQHYGKDACRRDDLWAFMYSLVELINGTLPWEDKRGKRKIFKMKRNTPLSGVLQGCPKMFETLMNYLDKLDFYSCPSYSYFREAFQLIIKARGIDLDDCFDWELYSGSESSSSCATTRSCGGSYSEVETDSNLTSSSATSSCSKSSNTTSESAASEYTDSETNSESDATANYYTGNSWIDNETSSLTDGY